MMRKLWPLGAAVLVIAVAAALWSGLRVNPAPIEPQAPVLAGVARPNVGFRAAQGLRLPTPIVRMAALGTVPRVPPIQLEILGAGKKPSAGGCTADCIFTGLTDVVNLDVSGTLSLSGATPKIEGTNVNSALIIQSNFNPGVGTTGATRFLLGTNITDGYLGWTWENFNGDKALTVDEQGAVTALTYYQGAGTNSTFRLAGNDEICFNKPTCGITFGYNNQSLLANGADLELSHNFIMGKTGSTNVFEVKTPDSVTSSTIAALTMLFVDQSDNDVAVEFKQNSTVEARLYESGEYVQLPGSQSIADNGGGTMPQNTVTMRNDTLYTTCSDTNPGGCELFFGSCQYANAKMRIVNIGAQPIYFDDQYTGTVLMRGDFWGGTNSVIEVVCDSNLVWQEISRSVVGGTPTFTKVNTADVQCTDSSGYCTIFSYTPPQGAGASKSIYLNAQIMITTGSTTVAPQFRVVSSDSGYVGICTWELFDKATTTTTAPAYLNIAIGTATADTAGTTWPQTTITPVRVVCALQADASPGAIDIQWQLETGSSPTQTVEAGSYFTVGTY